MLRKLFLVFGQVLGVMAICMTIGVGFAPSENILHLLNEKWHYGPSPLHIVNEKINREAQKVPEEIRQKIKRVVYFDLAYPKDTQEFAALDGYAILLVNAISHDQTELPVKRAFARTGDNVIELKRISYKLYQQDLDSFASQTFGQYRMDGLYLFPVTLRNQSSVIITIDFARNRDGFVLVKYDKDSLFDIPQGLPLTPPSGKGPSSDTLKKFITREFPGFEIQ